MSEKEKKEKEKKGTGMFKKGDRHVYARDGHV